MDISVCIQSGCVRAVAGTVKKKTLAVESFVSETFAPDAVAGGVIVNEDAVKNALVKLRGGIKNLSKGVHLVLDSASILVKSATVPVIPEKKMLKLVESEFADLSEGRPELLYDYMPLEKPGAGGANALCFAVEKELVGSYVSLMESAKIKLNSIGVSPAAFLRFASTAVVRDKICIMAVLNGSMVDAALFANGAFLFFNHARIFAERGTQEAGAEIARALSSMMQFNSAEKTGGEVTDIFFGGLTQAESGAQGLCGYVGSALSVRAREFDSCAEVRASDSGFRLSQYLYCVGNLLGR